MWGTITPKDIDEVNKRLKTKLIYECRCDERLNTKVEESTRLACTVARQNKLETPKEKDEVNKREVHECDVRTRDPDAMVVPPTPKPRFINPEKNTS